MSETPAQCPVKIPRTPLIAFYTTVLLYENIVGIQDNIDEDNRHYQCKFMLNHSLTREEEEEMSGKIRGLVLTHILPVMPEGYICTFDDIQFEKKISESWETEQLPLIARICAYCQRILQRV